MVAVAGAPSSSLATMVAIISTHFLGRDVHDQVFALARHSAVPALEQVPHGKGHLTAGAAQRFLQLVHAYTGSGLSGLDSNCRRLGCKNMDMPLTVGIGRYPPTAPR